MTTGMLIKDYRLERGFTQKHLGESCGIDEAQIRKYESGRVTPKTATLIKIANALSVSFVSLLPDGLNDLPVDSVGLAVKQHNHVKNQVLAHIANIFASLPFEELNDICMCLQALTPSEIHGHLWNARNASMNGHTPEMINEWLMHQVSIN